MIEIKHLKTLQALAAHGTLVKTADALFMTQSALSHQIKQLEQTFELTLFERKSNPLVFTPAGKVLLNLADEVLPKLQQTERTLKQLASGEQGRLWIGVECHTCFEWLLPLLRQFQSQWPNIDVDLISSLSKSALHGLEQEQLDLVITSDPLQQSELEFHPLFSYEIQLVLPPNHPKRSVAQGGENQQAWCSAEDLQDETLIVYPVAEEKLDVFRQFLNPAHVRPALRQTEMTVMMLHWVESGRGVCALPKWLLDSLTEFSHLPRMRLGPNGIWSTLYAATRRGTSQMPYVQDFIDRIQQRMTKGVE